MAWNDLSNGMADLGRLKNAQSRSISAENFSGAKGQGGRCSLENGNARNAARELGVGWKVNPYIIIKPGSVFELASIDGPGCINQIWTTILVKMRNLILRVYWDNQENPSVECPIGDFFCAGWNSPTQLNSLAVCINPFNAFNCYWQMPFRKHCRMTLENRGEEEAIVFYQINYVLTDIQADCAYFHAFFRRVNPLPYKDVYTIVDHIKGKGHYVGTYMAWGVNSNCWWGEGEIKFFIDGDREYPTICGTGTEDYFCGAYCFEDPVNRKHYAQFSTPYAGMHQVITPGEWFAGQLRFGLYRWHILDPVYFDQDIKVTMQALGWRDGGKYLPMQDDIASVAFWYQTLPHAKFPALQSRDELEVI